MRSWFDLPEPFGPTVVMISSGFIAKFTPRSTVRP